MHRFFQAGLAMARNPIIYGLAEEIFVAESSEKGGTWSGVIDGLRKGRTIYVRTPEPGDKNANDLLIAKGAVPVNSEGTPIQLSYRESSHGTSMVAEPDASIGSTIRTLLEIRAPTAKEICISLDNDWSTKKLAVFIKTLDFVEITKVKGVNYYGLKRDSQEKQADLFGDHFS